MSTLPTVRSKKFKVVINCHLVVYQELFKDQELSFDGLILGGIQFLPYIKILYLFILFFLNICKQF